MLEVFNKIIFKIELGSKNIILNYFHLNYFFKTKNNAIIYFNKT